MCIIIIISIISPSELSIAALYLAKRDATDAQGIAFHSAEKGKLYLYTRR
jgi:hypothetical protein